jgi:hypothetical protein
MAIRSIVEECGGFASKYIVPRQQHAEPSMKGYRAWAKVSIEWSACDYWRSPTRDKTQENAKIVEGQRLYDEMMRPKKAPESAAKTEQQVRELIQDEQSSMREAIGDMKSDIEALKHRISQPQVIEQVNLPATDSQKKVCEMQYQSMMRDATVASVPYQGNMAAPEVRDQFNRAMQQAAICRRLK